MGMALFNELFEAAMQNASPELPDLNEM